MRPRNVLLASLLLLALCVFAAGCVTANQHSGADINTTSADLNPVLSVSIEKASATLAPGDVIEFKIPSNPTTGYSWHVVSSDGLTVTENFIAPADTKAMGAPGTQVYRISAEKAGTYTFKATYDRPWENDTAPVSVFTQSIVVADGTKSENQPAVSVSFDSFATPTAKEIVKISVHGNPTTGYQWTANVPDGLTVVKSEYVEDANPDGAVGVGGTYVWYVTAEKPGTYTFSAGNQRSWEGEAIETAAFNLTFL